MVVGFNHNFRYRNHLFHVQTEDGGLKNPQIVTHLFSGGTILSSRKTSYADIIKVNNLGQVVEELMKEQHREMLRRLKDGNFDVLIRERLGSAILEPATPTGRETAPSPTFGVPSAPGAVVAPGNVPPAQAPSAKYEASLDDIILSYLIGDSGRKT